VPLTSHSKLHDFGDSFIGEVAKKKEKLNLDV
jgi:hypothetical protein